jgi:V/A-type H+-transporting ATPase subunit I
MIADMTKIVFVGLEKEKEAFLLRLQELGVAHLILPPEAAEPAHVKGEMAKVAGARKFLARVKVEAPAPEIGLDPTGLCDRLEVLKNRESVLRNDVVVLRKELVRSRLWGEYDPETLTELRGRGFDVRFYKMPRGAFENIEPGRALIEVTTKTDSETAFVAVAEEPLPLKQYEEKPPVSPSRLSADLEKMEAELTEIKAEYVRLAGGLGLLEQAEVELANRRELEKAKLNTDLALDEKLFVVNCWTPESEDALLKQIGPDFTLATLSRPPEPGDRVPVLMVNKPFFSSGEDLVKVYSNPNQDDFDPSASVMVCFAVFFGMILGDFCYGAVLFAITALIHLKTKKKGPALNRFLRLSFLVSVATMVFGVIGGSYFGIELGDGNPLNKMVLLNMTTPEGQQNVMLVSILIGMVHISYALAIKFYRQRDLPSLGWIVVIWAGYALIRSKMAEQSNDVAMYIMIAGFALVLLFTSKSRNPLIRFLAGLNGCLGAIQIFSDVLSYLRLFALGLATAYMSQTFNTLADMVWTAVPYVNILLAPIVLLVGHTINLVLGVMGGVIHGLRLNFLEWYRWCFEGDGLLFKPFELKKLMR